MKGVVAEHVILLAGLLEMEQRRRGAETELGDWLGVRGWSNRQKCEGNMMVKQRRDGGSTGDTETGAKEGWMGRCLRKGTALSGVDSDNLTAASADQEDPVEPLSEDLEELHVWERRVKETGGSKFSF